MRLNQIIIAEKGDQLGFYISLPHLVQLVNLSPKRDELWSMSMVV